MRNFSVEFEGSEFLRFFYDYLVDTRRMIWNSNRNEGPGTFMVTSDIARILTTMIATSPQEEFKTALRNKIRGFLSKSYEEWKIEEADVVLSIIETSGQFMSLTVGSHVKINGTQQHGIILLFSPDQQKAFLMYKGPSLETTQVDIHKLVPEYCDRYFVEQPLLD